MFVTYNRLYNAANVDCDIAKFKTTHVYRASDPNASGLCLRWSVRASVGLSYLDRYESLSSWATLTSTNLCRVQPFWQVRISVGLSHPDQQESLSGWSTLTGTNVCRLSYLDQQESLSGLSYFGRYKSMLGWAIISVRISAELTYLDWTLSWLSSVPQDNCRTYIELYHDSFLRSPLYFVTNHFTNRRQCKLLSTSLQKS
jgi:hypothetical protein